VLGESCERCRHSLEGKNHAFSDILQVSLEEILNPQSEVHHKMCFLVRIHHRIVIGATMAGI